MDFSNPTFWVAVGFVIFVALTVRPIAKAALAALDDRAARIKAQLDEAQTLREEAQKTLAEYQRKQRDAVAETEKIIEHAKEETRRIRDEAEADLERSLARRAQQAEEKIRQAEAAALKEVRNQAVDVALAAAARLIAEEVKPAKAKKIIDQSIDELSTKLN
jgi:F-type H+-transporting ATPase subunit b